MPYTTVENLDKESENAELMNLTDDCSNVVQKETIPLHQTSHKRKVTNEAVNFELDIVRDIFDPI